jgi:ABC-type multidrug transport system fused ATPase/permease subunit
MWLFWKKLIASCPIGKMTALCGSSGCEESMTISLIEERFYDPSDGQLFVQGCSMEGGNVNWLQEQIGHVAQEPILFRNDNAEYHFYG